MAEADSSATGTRCGGDLAEPDQVACPNCGTSKQGRFCAVCGQNDRDYLRSWFPVVSQILAETFEADSRVVRTLRALILRPGHLSLEFTRNRRAHYLSPFRLYLFTSLLFFLVLSLTVEGEGGGLVKVSRDDTAESPQGGGAEVGDRRAVDAPIRIHIGRAGAPGADPDAPGSSNDSQTDASPADLGEQIDALKRLLDEPRQRRVDDVMQRPGTSVPRALIIAVARAVAVDEGDLGAFDRFFARQLVDVSASPWPMVRDRFVGYLPAAMFLVLPLYALMLKVFYVRRRRYYAEHLVFSMHIHTIVFMVFGVMLLTPDGWPEWLDSVPMLALLVYYFIALKRFYKSGVMMTLLAFFLLMILYSLLLAATLAGAFVALVMLF